MERISKQRNSKRSEVKAKLSNRVGLKMSQTLDKFDIARKVFFKL